MGQPLRIEYAGARYHVVVRAVFGHAILLDDADRRRFLRRLRVVVERYGWICTAYCLMGTHFHLVLETPRPNLALGMQALNSVYARGFNVRHGRHGHVFSERYAPTLILTESHLLEAHRYVILNPVRAGVCGSAADYRWSSYRATAGLSIVPKFLAVAPILALFAGDVERARIRYRIFIAEGALPRRPRAELAA